MGKLEKQNNVFHLEVQAYNNSYGNLIERDSYYSEVYSTLEKAIKEGKWFIDRRFKDIYQQSNYCTNEKDTLSIEDMLKDNVISYCFKITELDPIYADSFEPPKREYMCRDLKPTHITHYYDLQGKLKSRYFEYLSKNGGYGYVIQNYPGDDENAQNKFQVGDFVTVEGEKENEVFVVATAPVRNDPHRLFENTYTLATITDEDRFYYDHDYHERNIKRYEGTIQEDSPLMLLKKIYTNEINIDQDTWGKIQENKIILNRHPSFRDIKELKGGDNIGRRN